MREEKGKPVSGSGLRFHWTLNPKPPSYPSVIQMEASNCIATAYSHVLDFLLSCQPPPPTALPTFLRDLNLACYAGQSLH